MRIPATPIGLFLALLGPTLLAFISVKAFTSQPNLSVGLSAQAVLVLLCACVLAIILGWEHRPLSSIGVLPLRWQSFAWGLSFAAFLIWVYSPLLARGMAF